MAAGTGNLRRAASEYMERTHRPLNCLLFLLPMLAAYEAGALLLGRRLLAIRYLSNLLELFGATGRFLPPVLLVLVLLAWHVLSRQKWRVDAAALLGMALESVLLMVPLVLLTTVGDMVAGTPPLQAAAGAESAGPAAKVLTNIGAGIYEEFLFRLAGISVILFICVDVLRLPRRPAIVAAAIVSAAVFSLYHSPLFGAKQLAGFQWGWDLFVMRFLAGGYLALVYVARGFGIAVGAHACYNIAVTLSKL